MMKIKKSNLFSCILICLLLFSSTIVVYATDVMPCYDNILYAETKAYLSDEGVLTIYNEYSAANDAIAEASITTYIEKRFLGIFWARVDIGVDGNAWTDTSTTSDYWNEYSFQLSSTGKYRITTEYIFTGIDGNIEEVTSEATATYE